MIKSVVVTNLRGIRSARLKDLTRLVVLVGPNGAGKSTILEACLIGGTRYPAAAIGLVVRHRFLTWSGARWLLPGGEPANPTSVAVTTAAGVHVERQISWVPKSIDPAGAQKLAQRGAPGPYSEIEVLRTSDPSPAPRTSRIAIATNNEYVVLGEEAPGGLELPFLRFVEPRSGEPLHDVFSRAVKAGHRTEVLALAKGILPTLEGIEILTEEGSPRLFLTFHDHALPATLSGDGMQVLLRTVFELASVQNGTTLLEEPEVHQHPASLMRTARAVVQAVRRGSQVILTTHSLELIEHLLSQLEESEICDSTFMSILRTRLVEGEFHTTRVEAQSAERALVDVAEDLR